MCHDPPNDYTRTDHDWSAWERAPRRGPNMSERSCGSCGKAQQRDEMTR